MDTEYGWRVRVLVDEDGGEDEDNAYLFYVDHDGNLVDDDVEFSGTQAQAYSESERRCDLYEHKTANTVLNVELVRFKNKS